MPCNPHPFAKLIPHLTLCAHPFRRLRANHESSSRDPPRPWQNYGESWEDLAGGKAKPQSHMRFTGAERRACEERCTGALPGLSATQKKAPQQASATQARAPQEQAPRRKSAVLGGGFCHRLFGGESKETKASKKGTTSRQAKIVRQLARQESLNYGESWEDLTSKARPESSRRRSTDPAARAAGTASPNERLRI